MAYKQLPAANPPYKAPWVETADSLLDNVRQLVTDVPGLRTDLTGLTTRVSLAESAAQGIDTVRSDVRSLSSQVSAASTSATQAAQAAQAAQTAAATAQGDAATSAQSAQSVAATVTGLSTTVTTATADITALKTGKADKAGLATVATTGKWADLIGAPTGGGSSGAVTYDGLPAGTVVVTTSTTTRPTARTDLRVVWRTLIPPTAVMLPGDTWEPATAADPAPQTVQTFTLSDGAAWPSPWVAAQTPAGGGATVVGQAGQLKTGAAGNYADTDTVSVRYGTAANVDVTFTARLVTAEPYPKVVLRSDQDSLDPGNGVIVGWSKTGMSVTTVTNWTYSTVATASKAHTVGVDYRVRVSAAGGTVRARTWQTGTAEPGTWDVTATVTNTAAGFAGLSVSGGTTATAQTVLFDDITITAS